MAALKKFGAAFEALRECACAVERGDLSRADFSMKSALDLAEDDNESDLVRYFAQALARRAYRLLPPKYPPDYTVLLYSFTPPEMIEDTIGKAVLSGKSTLHLIFFSLNFFDEQTESYMQKLERLRRVPQLSLKITLVVTSNSGYITTGFDYLRHRAKGIEFEFNRVVIINQRLDELDVSRLKIDRDDEFVVVSCSFLLGYMLPVALNKFLLMLRDDINPDIFLLAEYDANLNQDEFLQRFDESLQHYSNLSTFFDGYCFFDNDVAQHLLDEISNVVACEGGARVVRHMTSYQWRDLLNKSGFSSIPVVYDRIDFYGFNFKIENGCMKINGKGQGRPLFFLSAWEIKESTYGEDSYHNSLGGDDIFRNLSISPDPQHHSLIRMASLAEIHDMTYRKLQDYEADYDYHVKEILVWGKCEDNHNDGRSSQLNPCLCIVDQIRFIFRTEIPKYHLQERNYVTKTFESNQPCFVPVRTYGEKGLSIYRADDLVDGAFAIKLNSRHANCEGYVVVFLFTFPNGMVGEERIRRMEKILWDLRNEKSYFVTCSTLDDFLDKLEATPDAVRIIDNPSVQSQSHNNVMDMNVPWLQLLHGSSTPNAMPASHQNDLLDSSTAELLNQNEVSTTPSAKPARDQSLLALPTSDINAKEVSIKGKRKIETEAPSTSKPNKSPIWRHVQTVNHVQGALFPPHRSSTPSTKTTNVQNVMSTRNKEVNKGCIKRKGESKRKPSPIWQHVHKETSEDGKKWVKCNYNCGFHREDDSRQGTKVWMNHLERLHNVIFKNVQESSEHPPTQMTGVETEIFKDVGFSSRVTSTALSTPISGMKREKEVTWAEDLTEDVQTKKISSRRVVITNDEWIEGSKQWENALVGYVLGPKPTLEEMTSFARTRWEKFRVPKVSLVDDNDGIFLFDFESLELKRVVWELQWTYNDHLLVLREWTLDLDLDNLKVSGKVSIWVELPKLHLCLWNPLLLEKLAKNLGTLLDMDTSTKNREQLTCARILVEVDIDNMNELPYEIPIDLPSRSFNQPVVFDRKSVQNSSIASMSMLQKADGTTVTCVQACGIMEDPRLTWSQKNVRDYLMCPFTSEESKLLDRWRNRKLSGKIVIKLGRWDIKDGSLAPLVCPLDSVNTPDKFYIDDTVIDAFFHLLKRRCDIYPNMHLKHYSFSCLMASKLFAGQAGDLSSWYDLKDLAGAFKLFLPLCLSELSHWVLFYVNIPDQQMLWLDPYKKLRGFYGKEMRLIYEWFTMKLLPDLGYKDASNWEVKVQEDVPTQENTIDCGIFVMKYADCLTHGDCFPFSQADMIHFRERIFLDIVGGNIHVPQKFIEN